MDRFVKVFHEYEERLRSFDYVPRFSYGRRMMRDDGDPIKYFLLITYDILRREPVLHVQSEYSLSPHTVADWGMYTHHLKVSAWAIFLSASYLRFRQYYYSFHTTSTFHTRHLEVTHHLKVRVWAIFFSASYLWFRQYYYSFHTTSTCHARHL